MKKLFARLAAVTALTTLGACAGPDVTHYAANTPVFDPANYFAGKTEAWGMFQKRSGEVVKRMHVEMTGTVSGNQLVLEEHFSNDDGTKQDRTWTLVRQPDGSWIGTAGDVIGQGIGRAAGNAFNLRYTLLLPVDGKTYEVQMDDWIFQSDADTLLNRTTMSKFGVELGQATLFFRKTH